MDVDEKLSGGRKDGAGTRVQEGVGEQRKRGGELKVDGS